jgi:hypothetical protein
METDVNKLIDLIVEREEDVSGCFSVFSKILYEVIDSG